MPRLRAAFDAGAVPFEVVEMITRRINDDRVVDRLIADDEVLTNFSIGRSTDDVRRLMSGWDRIVDPVGAAEAADRAIARRQVKIVRKDGEVRIYARFGAAQGEEIAAVHERFAKREFERDAAEAVDGELPRSADQRSADALAAAMQTADAWFSQEHMSCPSCGTTVPAPSGSREPLTTLVFDEASLRRWLEGDTAADATDLDLLRRFAAGTADGAPVPADDLVRSMLLGQVRVILRRSDGVITTVGRRQRLFRGLIRDAVTLQHPTCIWPGCGVPASRCEADHLHPHAVGGATASCNGGPLCGFHNRFKAAHGFRVERGDEGRWHVLRPDGAPITGDPPPRRDRAGPGAA